jgi:hypothetical protein
VKNTIYRATKAFMAEHKGRRTTVRAGQTIREGHPLLKGREHLFEALTVDFEHTTKKPPKPKKEPKPKKDKAAPAKPAAKTEPADKNTTPAEPVAEENATTT